MGLGLAVDVEKPDGTRTLLVPCIKDADTLDFRAFVVAYEDLVRKVHANKVAPDDFAGTTVTLTNPGTLGTVQSVPRLMPGQGVIVGVGALGLPAGLRGRRPPGDRRARDRKVVTLTSTYDHRIIQGAESGLFLAHVAECSDRASTTSTTRSSSPWACPTSRSAGSRTSTPPTASDDGEHQRMVKQVHVQTLINMYRVRGHLIAHLDPLDAEPPELHPELDPAHLRADHLGPAPALRGRRAGRPGRGHLGRDPPRPARRLLPHPGRRVHAHPGSRTEAVDPASRRRGVDLAGRRRAAPHPRPLNAAEVFERFLHTRYVGQKRFGLEGPSRPSCCSTPCSTRRRRRAWPRPVMGMAHRGRLNVLANIVGKSYRRDLRRVRGQPRPRLGAGLGRREVPQGRHGRCSRAASGDDLPVTLASNPSHLEAVDPVVEGMARAKQDRLSPPTDGTGRDGRRPGGFPSLSVLVHGDAAFAGQGVVAETLNLSGLSGYRTGGTVHVVINNQLGFTTAPRPPAPRSTRPTWRRWSRPRSST